MSILEWFLCGLIVLPIVMFALAEIKRSKKYFVAGIAIISLYGVFLLSEYYRLISFETYGTKVQKDTLRIVNSGTGSLGSCAFYSMDGTDVLEETGTVAKRYGLMNKKFGWTFRAKKPGTGVIVVVQEETGRLAYVDAYRVTADDALQVSYEEKRVELLGYLYSVSYYPGMLQSVRLIAREGGETREIDTDAMCDFLNQFFGTNQVCEDVDVSAMDCLVLNYKSYDSYSQLESYEVKLYIDEDGHYFYIGKRREEDEWVEGWNEFIPDTWFDNSLFSTVSDIGIQ